MPEAKEETLYMRVMTRGGSDAEENRNAVNMVEKVIHEAGQAPIKTPNTLVVFVKRVFPATVALLLAVSGAIYASDRCKPRERVWLAQKPPERVWRRFDAAPAPSPTPTPVPACQDGPYPPWTVVNDGCSPVYNPITGQWTVGPDCGRCAP